MLDCYATHNRHLHLVRTPPKDAKLVWLDLRDPAQGEIEWVEKRTGLHIPTREEMQDIEVSSRLYHEDQAAYMTVTGVVHLDTDQPTATPLTFILKKNILVTVRYAEPRPFSNYISRAQRPGGDPCTGGEAVMLGLVEALLDRMSDALEGVSNTLNTLSHEIFSPAVGKKPRKDLPKLIGLIGRQGDMLALLRESLVSFNRMLSFHASSPKSSPAYKNLRDTLQRDTASLSDHATFLSGKINLLLDATLGLISVEQNQIIKTFSVAAVCLMPPTLVASVYGMNFRYMPELDWHWGYPLAVGLMVVSALLPIVYFRKKGWL